MVQPLHHWQLKEKKAIIFSLKLSYESFVKESAIYTASLKMNNIIDERKCHQR